MYEVVGRLVVPKMVKRPWEIKEVVAVILVEAKELVVALVVVEFRAVRLVVNRSVMVRERRFRTSAVSLLM